MKKFGRITIYGEYLMHSLCKGLIVPSNQFLTDERNGCNSTIEYQPYSDKVNFYLKKEGTNYYKGRIYGDLPLGYGFGSSTILGYIKLYKFMSAKFLKEAINSLDKNIHGFEPSGLDYNSVIFQKSMLFKSNEIEFVNEIDIDYIMILPNKQGERNIPLNKIKKIVDSKNTSLSKYVDHMNGYLTMSGCIDYNCFYDYCIFLQKLGLYTLKSKKIIDYFLERKIAAKCIGGLYNKAILIVWPDSCNRKAVVDKAISKFDFKVLI